MKDNDNKKKATKNPSTDRQHSTKPRTSGASKSETDNQWTSAACPHCHDNREHRDGPGGENL